MKAAFQPFLLLFPFELRLDFLCSKILTILVPKNIYMFQIPQIVAFVNVVCCFKIWNIKAQRQNLNNYSFLRLITSCHKITWFSIILQNMTFETFCFINISLKKKYKNHKTNRWTLVNTQIDGTLWDILHIFPKTI